MINDKFVRVGTFGIYHLEFGILMAVGVDID